MSAGPRPGVWLDFDGVVNAMSKPDRSVWSDWVSFDFRAGQQVYPVSYSPTVVRFVSALAQVADVVWFTDWLKLTERFPAEIPGMPALPWLRRPRQEALDAFTGPRRYTGEPWWKYVVAHDIHADRPRLWIDDLLDHFHPAYKETRHWADHRHPGVFCVAPNENVGLTPRPMRIIAEHLADLGHPMPDWRTPA